MSLAQTADNKAYSVDVVTEALLREHLTKKKYPATLAAFKSEQPQLQHSINKSSILQQLLGLEATAAELPSRAGGSSASTLELWVQQQLQGTACSTSSSNLPVPLPCKALDSTCNSITTQAGTSRVHNGSGTCRVGCTQMQMPGSQGASSSHHASSSVQGTPTALDAVTGSNVSAPKVPGSHSMVPATSSSSAKHAMAGGAAASSQPDAVAQQPALPHSSWHAGGTEAQLQGIRLAGLGPLRSSAVAAAGSVAATVGPAAFSSCISPSAALAQQLQEELVLEDIDDDGDEVSVAAATGTSCNISSCSGTSPSILFGNSTLSGDSRAGSSSSSSSSLANLQPLLLEQQRQLSKLLWGDEVARPDASWQQGLVFADTPGLEWGLLQLAGGPCGVLAAVQAHLIASLMEQNLWGLVLRPGQLQQALASSLTTLLWTARSGSSAKVVTLPLATGSAAARGMCDAAQALRLAQVASADSQQQLEVLVKAALPQWCQRKGWGLLMLLHSLLLTRGCSVVSGDMDEAGVPLVDGLGYCSMELVNLMITGAASSNVFDGRRQFGCEDDSCNGNGAQQAGGAADDGHVLMGVNSQARVGLLTLFEWYRYVEVGQNLKSPRFPVWVICSESHFSTLALAAPQQQQQQQPSAPAGSAMSSTYSGLSSSLQPAAGAAVVLQYYDGMARQEEPIQLQLLPAPGGIGWSSRMSGVAEDRGCWQGRPIPPMECVVETKWQNAAVTWQGSEPIL